MSATEYGTPVGVHVLSVELDANERATAVETTTGRLLIEFGSLASFTAGVYVDTVSVAELSERGRVYRFRSIR